MFSNNEYSEMEAELKAEVARLREELAKEQRLTRFTQQQTRDELMNERAAHEATKAERDAEHERACKEAVTHDQLLLEVSSYRSGMMAAEQRVAELERDIGAINNEWHAETMRKLKAERAIDQARGLLERAPVDPTQRQSTGWCRLRDEWLRAHPATATPTLKPLALVEDRTPEQLKADGDEPATPAATGAEPSGEVCWHCMVHLEPEEPPHCEQCPRYDCCDEAGCEEPGCTDRVAAEKEQGT